MGSLTHRMKLSRAQAIALAAVIGALALLIVTAGPGNLAYERSGDPVVEASRELSDATGTAAETPHDPPSLEPPPLLEPRVEATGPLGPRGQVLEASSGTAIEGVTVRMRRGSKVLAETVTVRDGTFQLPRPERAGLFIDVATEGWRTTPARIRLDEEQANGREEIVFRAERIALAPLRGRLVDQATGEPIPHFLIRARGPSEPFQEQGSETPEGKTKTYTRRVSPFQRVEKIVTDAEGRFESAGGFEAGRIELVLIDDVSANRSLLTDLEMEPFEILHSFEPNRVPSAQVVPILIGPTYRFDISIPDGMRAVDFYVVFPAESNDLERMVHDVGAEDPLSAMAQFYGAGLEAMEPRTVLREGEHAWARFRLPVFLLTEEENHEIHVRSSDGGWAGSAWVSSIEGMYPHLVPIRLSRRGSIEGSVRGSTGRAVPSAWIELTEPGRAAGEGEPIHQTGADRRGRFAFKWLQEGDYRLRIQTQRYQEWTGVVSVEAGSTSSVEANLRSGVALGPISGVLRSRTGKHRSKGGTVALWNRDSKFHSMQSVEYRMRDGEFVAPFSFTDVPAGTYELTLRPLVNLRWNTLSMEVSPPAEGLEFVCEDDVATFDLGFRAVDAETGLPIEEIWTLVWHGDPLEDVRFVRDWDADFYPGVPEGVPIRWMARARGYRLAWGDESAFVREGERRVVELRLMRGWGQIFKVATDQGDPAPGVELVADGKPVGRTDARGRVILDLDSKPARLEFRLPGWQVVVGSIDPADDGFGSGPETPVILMRD
ncbi:MAG TPA: carboxypeptidase-like regulatory domain-containing protein [Planctomycetota bacterium]|nr:carboxypeptidase-like regulatory domain-containing protein [Planctomycetota bacterium]